MPDPFVGRQVLVVGAGRPAAEIGVEVSYVASRTFMSGIDPLNRIPWRLMNLVYGFRVARGLGPAPATCP
jgi:hypothetical protein